VPRRDPQPPKVMACRSCGCRDLRVVWTYRAVDGSIRRRRRCRHCGTESTTVERTLGDTGQQGRQAG
jgi:transcriptional regulator NrdR family protein